jgi:O-antigen/teichoic acid export membrane protein
MGYGVALKAAKLILATITFGLIARSLAPESYGIYKTARTVLFLLGAIATLGADKAILRYLPEVRMGRDPRGAWRLVAWAFGLQAVGWLGCIAVVLAFRRPLETELEGPVYGVLLLGLYLLITERLFDIATQIYHAVLEMRVLSVVSVVSHFVLLGTLILFFHRGWGVAGVFWAGGIANAIGFVALVAALAGRLRPERRIEAPPIALPRFVRYGLPAAAIGLLYHVVWRQSETLLLNHFWGPLQAGYFDIAYAAPQMVLEFVPAAVWPLVMASYALVFTLDRARAMRIVDHYYKLLFGIAVPLAVGGVVLGDRALLVLAGNEYAPAATLCRVFFLVQCVAFLGTPLSMTLYVLEKTGVIFLVYLGGAIVNVGLNCLLIPVDWQVGAALPVSIVITLTPVVYWVLLGRQGYRVTIPWAFLRRAALGSSPLLLLLPLRHWVSGPLSLLGAAVVAALLLGGGMRVVGLFRDDDRPLLELFPSPALRRGLEWFGREPR